MRRPGRRLSEDEARLWGEVARTVKPLEPAVRRPVSTTSVPAEKAKPAPPVIAKKVKGRVPPPLMPKPAPAKVPKGETQLHLDGSWERRIAKGTLVPDFSLDLHGSNLDYAYRRLMDGLSQGKAMGARVVLVVTGKPRPVDAMDRGERRGAIRAKIKDWLMVSEHASDIVAIRGAHRRHGGQGALYIVLKRRR
ncbi:Smr/MutS family protein [Novosphingobium decolorationis]|uniref:Smr/MutS family protein n=1 Tax=Novosphingobium decolorationis TaxID=2698673 RepID=A0ABX8E8E6_9SPHN|nr:Smr/MutS family protein [Novosphingobium decolorationis]MED5544482.1 Smr/MutS family protein [Pseudomonadota bacterium]QVM85437.1 Smr/MutS family protein [Novosphingobium decolorationis]